MTPEDIRKQRADRDRSNREDAAKGNPARRRLKERHAFRDWPIYASTLAPAVLDPSEVRAPPLPEPPPMEQLKREAETAPDAVDQDERDAIERRRANAYRREREHANRLFGEWTPERVDEWLVEMNAVLIRLPIETRPRGYSSTLRQTIAEFQDVVAREENRSTRTFRNSVRHRWGELTMPEVRRSDLSMSWCGTYLKDHPDLAVCVGLGARWKALDVPMKKRIRKALNIWPSQFFARRRRGLEIIAAGLKRDGVRQ